MRIHVQYCCVQDQDSSANTTPLHSLENTPESSPANSPVVKEFREKIPSPLTKTGNRPGAYLCEEPVPDSADRGLSFSPVKPPQTRPRSKTAPDLPEVHRFRDKSEPLASTTPVGQVKQQHKTPLRDM